MTTIKYVIIFLIPASIWAVSQKDIDKLTTYSTMAGRALGCGMEISEPLRKIGTWMDKKFPPGSKDQQTYLPIFAGGMKMNMDLQMNGRSPDSCSSVSTFFSSPEFLNSLKK